MLVIAAAIALMWAAHALRVRALLRRERARFEDRLRERERIARDLHDTLLQGTQGLVLNLQVVASEMPRGDERRRRLEALLDDADAVIASARDRVHELRDLRGDIDDLVDGLLALGLELARGRAIRFDLRHAPPLPALHPDVGAEVFNIVREALVNAFRHAHALAIEIDISRIGRTLRIAINDNGQGIDPGVIAAGGSPGRWGLKRMRERASRIDARLDLLSLVHGGTQVLLEVPLHATLSHRAGDCLAWTRRRMTEIVEKTARAWARKQP